MSEEPSTTAAGPSEESNPRFGGNGDRSRSTKGGGPRIPLSSERWARPVSPLPVGMPQPEADGDRDTIEAVGRLAGRVAHQLGNLLTVVDGNTAFLEEALKNRPEDRRFAAEFQEIRSVCGRAADLTRQLLSISGQRSSEPQLVDLRTLVSDMEPGYFFGDHVAFITDFAAVTCPAWVDPARMEEVVLALLMNARDAVDGHGTVRVEIGLLPGTTRDGSAGRGWVDLEVSDSGPGMGEDTLGRVFHPFFSTHPLSEDRGLGLSVARGIVEQNGGTMKVSSTPGSGTTVRVRLPAAASVSASDRRS
jgi:signal transduction histidine kinase